MRSGGGGLCIVLGLLWVSACGADGGTNAASAPQVVDIVAETPPIAASEFEVAAWSVGGSPRPTAPTTLTVEPVPVSRPSSGCDLGVGIDPGVHLRRWHDVDRQVIVRMPSDAELAPGPAPVVLNLHASAASAASHDAYIHFSQPATDRGYVVLVPEGMPPGEGGLQVWELFPGIYPDDPGYLASLVDWIGEVHCVDLDRVYATGFSNGSTMTNVLACHTGGRFAAIGAVGAHRYPIRCPSGPVSVLGIHGTADGIVPYLGGPLLRRPEIWMPPVEETFDSWAQLGRCDPAPHYAEIAPDVVRRRWVGCARGVNVELYTVEGGGHSWPWADDPLYPGKVDATTLILDFFDVN
jgi:polyhydroxybutyrate depolymerase